MRSWTSSERAQRSDTWTALCTKCEPGQAYSMLRAYTKQRSKLTRLRPSRPTHRSRWTSTSTIKMSPPLRTPSLKVAPQTYPSTAKRPTFCSTLHHLSAMSPSSPPWRREPPVSVSVYSSVSSLSETSLVVLSRASFLWPCVCLLVFSSGPRR